MLYFPSLICLIASCLVLRIFYVCITYTTYLLYIVVVYQPNIKIAQNKQAAKLETTYLQIRKRKSRYLLREITFCPFIYSHYIYQREFLILRKLI